VLRRAQGERQTRDARADHQEIRSHVGEAWTRKPFWEVEICIMWKPASGRENRRQKGWLKVEADQLFRRGLANVI
jgi:hypothetical protein